MATAVRAVPSNRPAPVEEKHEPEAPEETKPRRKLSRKMLIGIVLGTFLIAAGGASAWYFTSSGDSSSKDPKELAKAAKAAKTGKTSGASDKPSKPPVFLTLPQFTVNLQGERSDQFLQTTIIFELSDEAAAETVKAQMPVIRSRLLLLLSSKAAGEILTLPGKEALVKEMMSETSKYVKFASNEQRLAQMHFNSFVIQ